MFGPAEGVLRAIERGETPSLREVRELARAVLDADPMTALAVRLRFGPAKRIRPGQAAELAAMVVERLRAGQAIPQAADREPGGEGGSQ
jgi:hypothetical protein